LEGASREFDEINEEEQVEEVMLISSIAKLGHLSRRNMTFKSDS
jgi:hypothetical protein